MCSVSHVLLNKIVNNVPVTRQQIKIYNKIHNIIHTTRTLQVHCYHDQPPILIHQVILILQMEN